MGQEPLPAPPEARVGNSHVLVACGEVSAHPEGSVDTVAGRNLFIGS